jgi:hypothetical protein
MRLVSIRSYYEYTALEPCTLQPRPVGRSFSIAAKATWSGHRPNQDPRSHAPGGASAILR